MISLKVSNKYNYCRAIKIVATSCACNNEFYTAIWTNEEIGSMLVDKDLLQCFLDFKYIAVLYFWVQILRIKQLLCFSQLISFFLPCRPCIAVKYDPEFSTQSHSFSGTHSQWCLMTHIGLLNRKCSALLKRMGYPL